MSDMAKKARAAMKAKASKMTTADPHQKVDSSTWTPAEPLNTEAKTGLRPVSRRAFKKGGKVMGSKPKTNLGRAPRKSGGEATQYAIAKINRNVKDANEERPGVKHVGALKRGGAAKRKGYATDGSVDEIGKFLEEDTMPMPEAPEDPAPYQQMPDVTPAEAKRMRAIMDAETRKNRAYEAQEEAKRNYGVTGRKSGGKVKKALGGSMAGAKRILERGQETAGVPAATMGFTGLKRGAISPARGIGLKKGGTAKHDDVKQDMALIKKMVKSSARKGREDGGVAVKKIPTGVSGLSPEDAKTWAERTKITKFSPGDYKDDRSGWLQKERETTAPLSGDLSFKKGGKAKRAARKDGGGIFTGTSYPGKIPGVVPGGRIARATGGKTKGKGKTNINIVIAAGKPAGQDMMGPPPGMDGGPKGMPIPVPPPGAGGLPMGGGAPMPMPMPMPAGPAPGPAPMPRKSGGRLTAKASSYKDMTAGSGGGEGRLQKTDIAKLHKDAPAFKAGGKVYKSYKDMDAGSGSGMGRLEKTEIQKRKG
jgi:hypothetical protein